MSTIIAGKVRFTVIDPMCVRMEFSPDGKYRDLPTLFAENRELCSEEFTTWTDDQFHLKTKYLEILYYADQLRPAGGTLRVQYPGGEWSYGKRNAGDLGGVLQSLDDCDAPMPLPAGFLSRDGWQVIDDTHAAVLKDGWIAADSHEETYFDLYFFSYAHEYKVALKLLLNLSGRVPLLPRWCMGSWYSRWYEYSSEDYRTLLREYQEHEFPLDVMVLDMEWHSRGGDRGHGWGGTLGWTGWSWNRKLLPDAEKLLAEFHDAGLRVAMNSHPHDGIRSHETCYHDFMQAMDAPTDNGNALPFNAADKKYLDNYFKFSHEPLEKDGCDLWWVDWQQDCIYPHLDGIPGQKHVPWLNVCYFNHMKRNHKRGIGFSRWGGFGDQKHPIHFSGDTTSTWKVLAFQIAFTALSGNSGCFFWTHDMGGFCGERQPELYARWLQFGTLTAAMRLHSAGDDVDRRPWKWEEPVYTSLKKSFQLRSRLMPYIYTSMRNACRDSLPMLKPLYLDFPEQDEAYRNMQEFFCGEAVLAAPITSLGAETDGLAFQKMWVPDEGDYCHYFTGVRYRQGTHVVPANLNEFPLLVRAGFPLVLGSPNKKHLADQDTEFTIELFPAAKPEMHSFTLYEDDGVTDLYEKGEFAETSFTAESSPDFAVITIAPSRGSFTHMVEERHFSLRVRNVAQVQSVLRDGVPVPFSLQEHVIYLEPVRLSRAQGCRWEIRFTQEDDATVRQRATEHYLRNAASPERKILLEGSGAINVIEPLSGTEEILIFPQGLSSMSIGGIKTRIETENGQPLILARKNDIRLRYSCGAKFDFV